MQSNSNQQVNGTSAVILVPSEPKKSNIYTNMGCIPSIRAFSIISIILGITSVGLQTAALCTNIPWYSFDPVGHGIWAGAFYIIAGSLGLASASKKTRALIITTVVFGSLSIASAIVAAVLSGLSATYGGCSNYYYGDCDEWYSLEWTLMGFSILAIFNSITLTVLASTVLCTKRQYKSTQSPMAQYTVGPAQGSGQPMQFVMGYPNQGVSNQGFVQAYPMQNNAQTMHHPMTAGVTSNNTQQALMVEHVARQAYANAPAPSLVQHQPELAPSNNEPLQQTSQQPITNETSMMST